MSNPPAKWQDSPVVAPFVPTNIWRYCGLKNLNNTCYSNACLQALYTSNKTRNQLINNPQAGPFHHTLSNLFSRMFQQPLHQSSGGHWYFPSISPVKFNSQFRLTRPEFKHGQQHDAQEFLNFLLDVLHQETNRARTRQLNPTAMPVLNTPEEAWQYHTTYVDDSPYSMIFMGQMESTLTCLSCGHRSRTWNCFWQLQLSLTGNSGTSGQAVAQQNTRPLSVNDCLQELMAEEVI